jgi:uncharacterized alkaline shock family protein YloU
MALEANMSEIMVEVVPAETATGDLASIRALPEDFARRATELADSITEVAGKIRSRLDTTLAGADESGTGWSLDQVELGFELALRAEYGVIIGKVAGQATFSVTLTWQKTSEGK